MCVGPSTEVLEISLNANLDSLSSASVSTASSSSIASDNRDLPPPPVDNNWEKFDEDETPTITDRPPLPPPRSELEKLYTAVPTKEFSSPSPVEFVLDSPTHEVSTNPFEASESPRPKSPFENFSSSVAEALISNSEQKLGEDLTSASALATAKELFETIQEQPDEVDVLECLDSQVSLSVTPVLQPSITVISVSEEEVIISHPSTTTATGTSDSALPLNPVSKGVSLSDPTLPINPISKGMSSSDPTLPFNPVSKGAPTSAINTTQLRTNSTTRDSRIHTNSTNRRPYNSSVLRPIPQEGTFSADSIANRTNPFYSGSVNAGNYPALLPISKRPSGPRSPSYVQSFPLPVGSRQSASTSSLPMVHRRPGRPPPKPQPYSGACPWNQQANDTNSKEGDVVVRRRSRPGSAPFLSQRLPSIGNFDPFGDLLNSEGGMTGYVLENSNASNSNAPPLV